MSEYSKDLTIDFSDTRSPNRLNSSLYHDINDRGWRDFVLRCSGDSAFPNTCVPIAGIIEHYRNQGVDITCGWVADDNSYIGHTRVHEPFSVNTEEGERRLRRPFDVVWKFCDSDEVYKLVEAVRTEVCEHSDVEEGVLTGIDWCLYEVMDNVLQHSGADRGYFMGQYAEKSRQLSLCVYDSGIGIFNTLKNSKHAPSTPIDAITMALQERVTRDDAIGQGNGMWGLSQMVQGNGGRYRVSSHGAVVSLADGSVRHYKCGGFYHGSERLGTTLVDFQIDCGHDIDVAKTLNHDPAPMWLENLENDEGTEYTIRIVERSEGTGTRRAAERVRHFAMNSVREGGKRLVFDFGGTGTVSSSYADELIGKLVIETGFLAFCNCFRMQNVSPLNQQVINRSVQQRMAQEYYGEPPLEDEPSVS